MSFQESSRLPTGALPFAGRVATTHEDDKMRHGGMSHPDGFRGLGAGRSLLLERFPDRIAVRADGFMFSED